MCSKYYLQVERCCERRPPDQTLGTMVHHIERVHYVGVKSCPGLHRDRIQARHVVGHDIIEFLDQLTCRLEMIEVETIR